MSNGKQRGEVLSRVAVEAVLSDVQLTAFLHCRLGLLLVKGWRFAGLDSQGASGAHGQTEASPVAQRFIGHPSLAINNLDGAFGARRDTDPTPIAQFLINVHDLTFRHCTPFGSNGLSSDSFHARDFGNLLLEQPLDTHAQGHNCAWASVASPSQPHRDNAFFGYVNQLHVPPVRLQAWPDGRQGILDPIC
jgi:hypothetical protein